MRIYIASSWKNQHTVEMLTVLLRERGHEVSSFVEFETPYKDLPFDKWIESEGADLCFTYDSEGAMNCDLCVYLSPSGKDAAAEVGMAYAKGKPIIALFAKGEDFGLMRKMMTMWVYKYTELLEKIDEYAGIKK